MRSDLIQKLQATFEDYVHESDGLEFWYARELQSLLGYSEWRNFLKIVEKAKESCKNANGAISDHFVDVNKSIPVPKGGTRDIDDIILSRYACYLIAQNGDPRKDEIAFAQSYFAVQTRKQEIIEEHIQLSERLKARDRLKESETEFSRIIYERGVDDKGIARVRSKGDKVLFGGHDTRQMKIRMDIPQSRPLADFLPTVTITAKNLATEITNFNVEKENLQGEQSITGEHQLNNADVRELLVRRGIVPEEIPAEEDLKKLERRVGKQEKFLEKSPNNHKISTNIEQKERNNREEGE